MPIISTHLVSLLNTQPLYFTTVKWTCPNKSRWQLRMHCNLKAARRRASHCRLFLANFVLHMRINCYLPGIESLIYFSRWSAVRIGRFHTFSDTMFRGRQSHPSFSKMGTKLHQILVWQTSLVDAPTVCDRYQVRFFVWEMEPLKVNN